MLFHFDSLKRHLCKIQLSQFYFGDFKNIYHCKNLCSIIDCEKLCSNINFKHQSLLVCFEKLCSIIDFKHSSLSVFYKICVPFWIEENPIPIVCIINH